MTICIVVPNGEVKVKREVESGDRLFDHRHGGASGYNRTCERRSGRSEVEMNDILPAVEYVWVRRDRLHI